MQTLHSAMKPILEVSAVSKKFTIRHESKPYLSLRDSLSGLFSKSSTTIEEFYALKDVSFRLMPGETTGIIGKNGAGKSTLLKILSRITPPTSGKVVCRGTLASLLEVGTGFHPELTGRENIFFNGSILGMKRSEIRQKLDSIVDFSGCERFLDTPLKHYSSGMQLRLAFSVAAFLENDILVVDEVLAVGDAEFQRKCLSKIENLMTRQGRTILFVSHNLTQIQQLCKQSVLLENGKVAMIDRTDNVISNYLSEGKLSGAVELTNLPRQGYRNHDFLFKSLVVNQGHLISENEEVNLEITFELKSRTEEVVVGFALSDMNDRNLLELRSSSRYEFLNLDAGVHTLKVRFNPKMKAGIYNIKVGALHAKGDLDYIPNAGVLEIRMAEGSLEGWKMANSGIVITTGDWSI